MVKAGGSNHIMKILLIGGSGFIGRNITESWQNKYDISAPTHNELDLLDTYAVETYLKQNSFDVVIFSANTNNFIHPEFNNSMLGMNLKMFFNLERCSKLYGKMYYFGSGAEYDSSNYILNMSEDYFGKHIPADSYGFSKYIMAKTAEKSSNIYDLCLFGVFGKYEEWQRRFISNMIYQSMNSQVMQMNHNMYFDYIYAPDLINILEWFLTNSPVHHRYNLCSGKKVDLYSLAVIIRDKIGNNSEIIIKNTNTPLPYTADNRLLLSELHNIELTPMDHAIDELIQYYKKYGFK